MNESLEEWLTDRPQIIKDLARSHPPDGEYRLASGADDDLYLIYSYSEAGTMKVTRYARLAGAPDSVLPLWNVVGMKPEELVRVDEAPAEVPHGEG